MPYPASVQEGTKEAMKQVIREGKVSPSYRPVKLVSATAPRPLERHSAWRTAQVKVGERQEAGK